MKKNVAIILSAGNGSRFGSEIPKQFINLAGKNIIEYTLEQFQTHQDIHEICIVANQEYHQKLFDLCKQLKFTKVKKIISGGKERRDSSFEAIKSYDNDKESINLIFHDAVRPFVSHLIISRTIEALKTYDAVDVAIVSADTIIQVDPTKHIIQNIPQRNLLQRGQTPQAFALKTIKEAHILAQNDAKTLVVTDDCGLIKHYLPTTPIIVVEGEEKNIKITYPEDLLFAEKLIQLNSHSLSSNKSLELLKGQVIVVYGGNSGIGLEIAKQCYQHEVQCIALSRHNGVDIQNANDIKKSLEEVYNTYGKINHIINCAAVLSKKTLCELHDDEIVESIQTNLTGSIMLAKYAFSYLKASKGSLTLFTSSSYTRGRSTYSLYSATKAAIVNLTQALSEEWQTDEVRINVINPARTKTPLRLANFGKEQEETLLPAKIVAQKTLQTILSPYSGLVIDIKKGIDA